ncbi:SDR family oxidoreductase [uncultured Roseibium sp.]|uniref:SDR family NAD(P)-dependent oxidoreductase n=1 Tax=uncultured Roseibium sp. TaxID=1936171 RepID=UPI002629EA08|nr:SDR family oxidoreductase [uncultured Roseibium sp.]
MTIGKKIALITGGSRGLGRNMALHLARHGIDSVLTYHSNKVSAEETVAEIETLGQRAVAIKLDTGDISTFTDFHSDLRAALKETWRRDGFDILINNAGTGVHKSFADTTEDEFDHLMNVHVKGVFFLTQELLPMLPDGGRILNISTGLARFTMPGYAAYATMKGAVETLTRYLAKELGPRSIAVNTLAPGAIETDFGGGAVRDVPELNNMIAGMTAMGRAGMPDDIGGAVAAILTGDTAWMTGQRIEVSGGQSL